MRPQNCCQTWVEDRDQCMFRDAIPCWVFPWSRHHDQIHNMHVIFQQCTWIEGVLVATKWIYDSRRRPFIEAQVFHRIFASLDSRGSWHEQDENTWRWRWTLFLLLSVPLFDVIILGNHSHTILVPMQRMARMHKMNLMWRQHLERAKCRLAFLMMPPGDTSFVPWSMFDNLEPLSFMKRHTLRSTSLVDTFPHFQILPHIPIKKTLPSHSTSFTQTYYDGDFCSQNGKERRCRSVIFFQPGTVEPQIVSVMEMNLCAYIIRVAIPPPSGEAEVKPATILCCEDRPLLQTSPVARGCRTKGPWIRRSDWFEEIGMDTKVEGHRVKFWKRFHVAQLCFERDK